jgi:hypothetical protein
MPVRPASRFLIVIVILLTLVAGEATPIGPNRSTAGADNDPAGWRWAVFGPTDDPAGWLWAATDPAGWRWD